MSLALEDLAVRMREIDTCLLCTATDAGLEARPMSNNRDVHVDTGMWFFTGSDTAMSAQIAADPRVLVTCSSPDHLWIAVTGTATVHTDRALMAQHWDADLSRWFADGVDTPGLHLIEVRARHVRYWSFRDGDGEFDLQ